jgi:hypothetical protein
VGPTCDSFRSLDDPLAKLGEDRVWIQEAERARFDNSWWARCPTPPSEVPPQAAPLTKRLLRPCAP